MGNKTPAPILGWSDNCSLRHDRKLFLSAILSILPHQIPTVLVSMIVDYALTAVSHLLCLEWRTHAQSIVEYPFFGRYEHVLRGWVSCDLHPRSGVPLDCNGWRYIEIPIRHPVIVDVFIKEKSLFFAIRRSPKESIYMQWFRIERIYDAAFHPSPFPLVLYPDWCCLTPIPPTLQPCAPSVLWKGRWCMMNGTEQMFWDFNRRTWCNLPATPGKNGLAIHYTISGNELFLIQEYHPNPNFPLSLHVEIYVLLESPYSSSKQDYDFAGQWHLMMSIDTSKCLTLQWDIHPALFTHTLPILPQLRRKASPEWQANVYLETPHFLDSWLEFCVSHFWQASLFRDKSRKPTRLDIHFGMEGKIRKLENDWWCLHPYNSKMNSFSLCRFENLHNPRLHRRYPLIKDLTSFVQPWQLHFLP